MCSDVSCPGYRTRNCASQWSETNFSKIKLLLSTYITKYSGLGLRFSVPGRHSLLNSSYMRLYCFYIGVPLHTSVFSADSVFSRCKTKIKEICIVLEAEF